MTARASVSDGKVKVGDSVTYRWPTWRDRGVGGIADAEGTVTSVGRVYLTIDGTRVARWRIAAVNGKAVRL